MATAPARFAKGLTSFWMRIPLSKSTASNRKSMEGKPSPSLNCGSKNRKMKMGSGKTLRACLHEKVEARPLCYTRRVRFVDFTTRWLDESFGKYNGSWKEHAGNRQLGSLAHFVGYHAIGDCRDSELANPSGKADGHSSRTRARCANGGVEIQSSDPHPG